MKNLFSKTENFKSEYCCSECGGTNVQVQAWVDANTNEFMCDVDDNGCCWCEDCEKFTTLKEQR